MSVWKFAATALLCGLVSACTAFSQFELEEPRGEVSLDGNLNASPQGGRIVYWGKARNTGDVDVEDVVFVIDVYGGDGSFLGRFSGPVSSGIEDEDPVTTLAAGTEGPGSGQSGDFIVPTTVPWGAAARTEYHAEFTEVVPEEIAP